MQNSLGSYFNRHLHGLHETVSHPLIDRLYTLYIYATYHLQKNNCHISITGLC